MSLSNYVPRGFPAAAIEHIKKHGPTMTGPLADAIGCDQGSLPTILQTAIAHGVLTKEFTVHMGRRVNQYRLGKGVSIRLADYPLHEHEDAGDVGQGPQADLQPARIEEPACTRSHPHEDMSPQCDKLTDQVRHDAAERVSMPSPIAKEPEEPPTTAQLAEKLTDVVDATFVEVAISNTGRLLICNGQQQIALSPEQTEKVFEYIDAHRGIEWEGA